MDQQNKPAEGGNPWDGIVGAVKETAASAVTSVKKMMPWEGVDTTPKPPKQATFKPPVQQSVNTEAKMVAAAPIQPHERMPDTQSAMSNLAEIEREIVIATKNKNSLALKILTQERLKFTRK